jgi:hypothetical protein
VWDESERTPDFDMHFDLFYNSVKSAILQTCNPLSLRCRPRKSEPLNPWVTPGLLTSWRRKNYLWKKWKASSLVRHLDEYKSYRNVFKSLIRRDKSNFYFRKFSDYGKDVRKT